MRVTKFQSLLPLLGLLCIPHPCWGDMGEVDPKLLEDRVKPFFASYCVDCHSGDEAKAGLRFEEFPKIEDFVKEGPHWQKVVSQIQAKGMPPAESDQPSDEDRAAVSAWLAHAATNIDCSKPQTPGRPTIRRLNRVEYNNTVRDLLGIDFKPADDFPADDVGEGFDNIGDVLSISPILIEKYLNAAETIASRAIFVKEPIKATERRFEGEGSRATAPGGTADDGKSQRLTSNGELYRSIKFQSTGDYEFRIRAYGEQGGDGVAKAALKIDNEDPIEFDVPATAEEPGIYKFTTTVKEGKRRVAVAFINDFFQKEVDGKPAIDRNLVIDYFEVAGPTKLEDKPLPQSHLKVIFRPIEPATKEQDIRAILERFALRAYRRPPTSEEIDRLRAIVALAEEGGEPIERGIQLAVGAVLVSPYFLFKVELDDPAQPDRVRELNDYELATRLSYFLWSSMPDDELLKLAAQGKLRDESVLRKQVERMIADKSSDAFVENFAGQWLQLRNLEIRQPDPNRFPKFNEELRSAMRKETELFFASVLREGRSVGDFITGDYTFVNEKLAKHYGIADVKGKEFRRVELKGLPRSGVLTQASILLLTSDPTRTSPVKRGKWVMETILGTPPATPPANVPEIEKQKLTGTLRQQMEQHRINPACATCHALMDPLGFGLENFDAIGAWRDKEGEYPIDASGKLPDGADFNGPKDLTKILSRQQEPFLHSLTEKMLTYALGRGLAYYDACEVRSITSAVGADNGKLATLVWEIVRSRPFRMRGPAGG